MLATRLLHLLRESEATEPRRRTAKISEQRVEPAFSTQSHSLVALRGHREKQCHQVHVGWISRVRPQLMWMDTPLAVEMTRNVSGVTSHCQSTDMRCQ